MQQLQVGSLFDSGSGLLLPKSFFYSLLVIDARIDLNHGVEQRAVPQWCKCSYHTIPVESTDDPDSVMDQDDSVVLS
jgi:hypothetical protein